MCMCVCIYIYTHTGIVPPTTRSRVSGLRPSQTLKLCPSLPSVLGSSKGLETYFSQRLPFADDMNPALLLIDYTMFPRVSVCLYYTLLYYAILYSTLLYCTILYYTILYFILLYSTLLYYTVLYYTILYHTIPYHTIPYHTPLYSHAGFIIISRAPPAFSKASSGTPF